MSQRPPEAYIYTGVGMIAVGIVLLIRGMRPPTESETIKGTVLSTKMHEGGDVKVMVEWIDAAGVARQSQVIVSSGDIPTKGTTMQLMRSRFARDQLRVARLKYRIGPALGILAFGCAWLFAGLVMKV